MSSSSTLGEEIWNFRKDRGLTQKQFAEKAGYSDRYISQIETGRTIPERTAQRIRTMMEEAEKDVNSFDSFPQQMRISVKIADKRASTDWSTTINSCAGTEGKSEVDKFFTSVDHSLIAYLESIPNDSEESLVFEASLEFGSKSGSISVTVTKSMINAILKTFQEMVSVILQ